MKNNNNPWLQLCNPMFDRPGMPHSDPEPVPVVRCTMPPCEVALAHAKDSNPWKFSERRMQILGLLVQGTPSSIIAEKLGVTLSAVTKNTAAIRDAMGVATNAQAVLAWHRHYRVLQPDLASVDKDDILVKNLERALMAQRGCTGREHT